MKPQMLKRLPERRALPTLSIVVPFYNEREVLPACVARLEQVLDTLELSVELVFVDDGSDDGSATLLAAMQPRGADLRLIRLTRNFGKEAAMSAGIAHARGEAVIVLDADLQDPPELIPEMIAQWRAGADVVQMQRRSRAGESWLKRSSAHAFYRLLARLSPAPIPLDTGDFRLMSRRAVDALLRLPERNRYMKGLYAWIGLPTAVLQYDRAARHAGRSKWRYTALAGLAMEGITSFSTAPLRLATLAGALTALAGGLYGLWIVAKALLFGDPAAGFPSLVALLALLGGMQLLGIGIVGEYVGKTYLEAKQRPLYLVQEERLILAGTRVTEWKARRHA
ncbi:glycosyltransferase family 2 protein [Thauera sp. Sel9]|uniref:glycosyltransferase family 2 protein n=1 Tax=Thauera sp. Sel9 TaxID=2974299 RepID=UPI0021E10341|nr:glycosyltransferase family 2 protein [Thauera sp. Sel9]MCV2219778.1 glycosyltransferase family 2 protein [Thauera sp. Sel9]